jgi:transposase-like protein
MDTDITSLEQFHQHFGTEDACAAYLFQAKWPNGFNCLRCGHQNAYLTSTRRLPLYECRECRYQHSLITGTILEGSRTALHKWFLAIFLVSRIDQGINAVELTKKIHVTYKTAWLMLQKIRYAISKEDSQTLLSGVVRVNTTTYGRPYHPSFSNHPQEHPLLVGTSLNDQGEPTYVKIKQVSESDWRNRQINLAGTQAFALHHVEPQTKDIKFVTGRFSASRFRDLLIISSHASKWINKTFHGLGSRHLQAYLDEFTYRLNLSILNQPIFSRLASLCVRTTSVTYLYLTRIA